MVIYSHTGRLHHIYHHIVIKRDISKIPATIVPPFTSTPIIYHECKVITPSSTSSEYIMYRLSTKSQTHRQLQGNSPSTYLHNMLILTKSQHKHKKHMNSKIGRISHAHSSSQTVSPLPSPLSPSKKTQRKISEPSRCTPHPYLPAPATSTKENTSSSAHAPPHALFFFFFGDFVRKSPVFYLFLLQGGHLYSSIFFLLVFASMAVC